MPADLKEVLRNFLDENNRIDYKLRLLAQLFRVHKDSHDQISKRLKQTTNPLKHFKMLILIEHCWPENVLQSEAIRQILPSIRSVPQQENQLHKIICSKVIPQYTLYLLKRYQEAQDNLNPEAHEQIYIKINLLKLCLEFSDILFTFGRYFPRLYAFIIDFNIVLAKDVKNIYDCIVQLLKINRNLLDEQMRSQIESLHQKMYIVFYNCYYYTYVQRFLPTAWIDTHSIYCQSPTKRLSKSPKRKSINITGNFETTQEKSRRKSRSSTDISWTQEIDLAEKTVLSRQQIEYILKICEDENQPDGIAVSQFNVMGEEMTLVNDELN